MTKKREYRKRTLKDLSKAQKSEKISAQVLKVQEAERKVYESKWRCADELAALVDLYHNCYGLNLTSRKLKQIAGIERNGQRLMTYAKLAKFFPEKLRIENVGLRVYEDAYKFNQKLKQYKLAQFTAEELVAEMAPGRGSYETRERLNNKVHDRDREVLQERKATCLSKIMSDPSYVRQKKKRWLQLIEVDPVRAVGAAIATLDDDYVAMHRINDVLKSFNCDWYLKYDSPWEEQDIEDIELD